MRTGIQNGGLRLRSPSARRMAFSQTATLSAPPASVSLASLMKKSCSFHGEFDLVPFHRAGRPSPERVSVSALTRSLSSARDPGSLFTTYLFLSKPSTGHGNRTVDYA